MQVVLKVVKRWFVAFKENQNYMYINLNVTYFTIFTPSVCGYNGTGTFLHHVHIFFPFVLFNARSCKSCGSYCFRRSDSWDSQMVTIFLKKKLYFLQEEAKFLPISAPCYNFRLITMASQDQIWKILKVMFKRKIMTKWILCQLNIVRQLTSEKQASERKIKTLNIRHEERV